MANTNKQAKWLEKTPKSIAIYYRNPTSRNRNNYKSICYAIQIISRKTKCFPKNANVKLTWRQAYFLTSIISNSDSTTHPIQYNTTQHNPKFNFHNFIRRFCESSLVLSGFTLVYAYEPLHNDDLFWLSTPNIDEHKKIQSITRCSTRNDIYIPVDSDAQEQYTSSQFRFIQKHI